MILKIIQKLRNLREILEEKFGIDISIDMLEEQIRKDPWDDKVFEIAVNIDISAIHLETVCIKYILPDSAFDDSTIKLCREIQENVEELAKIFKRLRTCEEIEENVEELSKISKRLREIIDSEYPVPDDTIEKFLSKYK
jgi:hypothetical protein